MSKDPYVYDDTNVLKNVANIKEQNKLDDYESTMVNLGIIKLLKSNIKINNTNDIFLIHKFLFENVYEWAGEKRVINISKTEPILNGLSVTYSDYKKIDFDLNEIQKDIDLTNWEQLSKNEMICKVVKIISAIWQVHSFREGNTRVVTLFLYYFLKKIGFKVNREFIDKHAKYFRNALVLASIGKYSEYNYLEEILKDSISFKVIDNEHNVKYQSIKGYNLDKYEYNYHNSKKDD
ncbi:MAG: Fic family protein [Acholeplasmataceae bacterium]|nr:Fic family protein [Acholeplasmataceae bacterium]